MTQAKLFDACNRLHVDDQRRKLLARLSRLDEKLDQQCPCCHQRVKLYTRKINAPMGRWLIWLVLAWANAPRKWLHVNDGPVLQNRKGGGDFAKLAYWGLITERGNEDQKKRSSGFWRPTPLGVEFVHNRTAVPEIAFVFNADVQGFSTATRNIITALGDQFDYTELMKGD